jgi:hypothetical protein
MGSVCSQVLGFQSLCQDCEKLQIGDHILNSLRNDDWYDTEFGITDMFPSLPHLAKTAQAGCKLCLLLRETLLSEEMSQDLRFLGVEIPMGDSVEIDLAGRYLRSRYRGPKAVKLVALEIYVHFGRSTQLFCLS